MILILVSGILLMTVVLEQLYRKYWNKDFAVLFAFSQPYVYAGEKVILKEVIENRKWLPISPVEIRFRMKRGISFDRTENTSVSDFVYKRDLYALTGYQRITREMEVKCFQRGVYPIEDISVLTYSLLKARIYENTWETEAGMEVFAKRERVSDIMRAIENLMGERESRRRYLEDPFAFAGIREYTPEDPMKTINWKASAKTGELMVNTFSSMQNEKMMLYLDVEDKAILKKDHLREACISIGATLYQKLMEKGTEVGICVNFKKEDQQLFLLKPSRKKENWINMERAFAAYSKEQETISFEAELDQAFVAEENSIPVFITFKMTPERLGKLESMLGKQKGMVVIPYERGDRPEAASKKLIIITKEIEA